MPHEPIEQTRPRLAVFDIDGTLVRCASERLFFRYLRSHGKFRLRQALGYLSFFPRYVALGGIHTAKKNKAYLYGLDTREVESLAQGFVAEVLATHYYAAAVQRVRWHRDRGDAVLLLSGTLDCVARAIGDHLDVRRIRATLPSERDNRYTTQPPELHPFGTAKLILTRQVASELGIGLAAVTAYGDSHHDLPLLKAVGCAVAVRPDRTLRQTARRLGWEIMGGDDDSNPILGQPASTTQRSPRGTL
ncbi:MAG: HAD family hydrolase [Gammaproteobacteria bacterium]